MAVHYFMVLIPVLYITVYFASKNAVKKIWTQVQNHTEENQIMILLHELRDFNIIDNHELKTAITHYEHQRKRISRQNKKAEYMALMVELKHKKILAFENYEARLDDLQILFED